MYRTYCNDIYVFYFNLLQRDHISRTCVHSRSEKQILLIRGKPSSPDTCNKLSHLDKCTFFYFSFSICFFFFLNPFSCIINRYRTGSVFVVCLFADPSRYKHSILKIDFVYFIVNQDVKFKHV